MEYFLQSTYYVGVSFCLVSVAMVAATVFFLYEGMHVKESWRVSMLLMGLVTLIAGIHYYYMRDYWIASQESPIVYRYIDWLLTVPLQMIEFYLILVAAGLAARSGIFWRLLVGSLVMIVGGYLGEAGMISVLFGFIIGMWADNFEKLQLIPILIITPLVFLGGSFYSINMLPEFWQKVSLLNPVLYLVSGFRWSFYEIADVSIYTSLITILFFLFTCVLIISYTFAKGYKIKS